MKTLRNIRIIILVCFCMTGWGAMAQNTNKTAVCNYLQTIVKEEVVAHTNPSKSDASIRVFSSKSKTDAYQDAQKLFIRLTAGKKETEKTSQSLVYVLPDNLGKITLQEINNDDCIFIVLRLETSCSLPVSEIQYVRLKCFYEQK